MGLYQYSQVAEGSIRLLRLMPHTDRQSHIHCQLFDFPLSDSDSTCPYEAMSYVWGSDEKPFTISVNNGNLCIGANLHAALRNLRHNTLDRIIWIDALCINQDDTTEKGQQVQLMAKIYAKANCVIVWLGEAADESDEALREICVAAFKNPTSNKDPKRIVSLLRRPWFQRIWVLQEVAAARHIVIKCGSTEIDGHAFCSGLSALKPSYENCKSLQPSIVSVAYLIRGAILRPRHTGSLYRRFSLDIRPLSELVEMYHTRKATERRDKVYALLGMSCDDPTGAGLSIDYTIPWSRVFENLIRYTLTRSLSVYTWNDREIAVIRGKGLVLGEVSSIKGDHAWEDDRKLDVTWKNVCSELFRTSTWTVQASVKSIQVGDVVCLFQAAKRPTIIRPCGSYWTIIMISVPPGPVQHKNITLPNEVRREAEWLDQLESAMEHSHDMLLVWDWGEHSIESLRDQETTYEQLVSEQFGRDSLMERLYNVTIMANMGLVLQDLERCDASEDCIRRAIAHFQETIKIVDGSAVVSNVGGKKLKIRTDVEAVTDKLVQFKGGWQPIQWASEDGHDLVVRLIITKADPNIIDAEGRDPLSWASEKGFETVVRLLLGTGAVDPDAKDKRGWTPLLWAASKGHEKIVNLLLETQKVDPDAKEGNENTTGTGRTPLLLASEGGHEAIVRRLLDTYKVDLNARDESGGTPLIWAVKNGHTHVVKLLLQTGKVDPNASDEGEDENEGGRTPLMWAASNCNEEIVKLLLQIKNVNSDIRDKSSRTAISLAAENGDVAIVKLLLGIGKAQPDVADKEGRTPLRYAAEGGSEQVVQVLLDTNNAHPNSKDKRGRTPLFSAARNGHEHVVSILAQRNELTFQELQLQVPRTSNHEHFLNIRDEEYFENRCQHLFSNVRQWVTRFSRAGDMRTSRLKDEINEEAVDNLEALLASQLDDDEDDPTTGLPARLTVGINDEKIIGRLDKVMLDGTDVDVYLSDRLRRRDVFTSMIMNMIWEFIFTRYLFGLDREQRQKLKSLEKVLTEAGPPEAVHKWRAITLTLLSRRDKIKRQRDLDATAVTQAIFQTLCAVLLPPDNIQGHLESQLHTVVLVAVELSIEMRTQKADYLMLPPLEPEYDIDGNLTDTVHFIAVLMNECDAKTKMSNEDLEKHGVTVRMNLFPIVVKKGGDDGVGEEEIVIYHSQVLVAPQNTDQEKVMVTPNEFGK